MKILLILSLLIFVGCNTRSSSDPAETAPEVGGSTGTEIENGSSDLIALANNFKTDYNIDMWSFPIGFKPASYMNRGNSNLTVIGVCQVYSDGSKKVWFNESWWNSASTSVNAKKILFYHEMGHCYFSRAHDSRTDNTGRPYSMMNPVIDPVLFYYNTGYSAYYIAELASPMPMMTKNLAYDQNVPVTLVEQSATMADGSCETTPL